MEREQCTVQALCDSFIKDFVNKCRSTSLRKNQASPYWKVAKINNQIPLTKCYVTL